MTESRTPRPDPEKSEEPIEFVVEGDRVRGTLYLPAQAAARGAGARLVDGGGRRSGGLRGRHRRAGLAALTFDFRNLGRSDGQPRQEIDPQRQIQDFRAAISTCAAVPRWTASASASGAAATAAAMP